MTLVTLDEARALIKTSLTDPQLQAIIARAEAEVVACVGAHYVNAATDVSETLSGGLRNLYLRRAIGSVTSIVEDGVTLTSADYRVWGGQGRIERLAVGALWGEVVTVSYTPADDNAARQGVIIELTRLAVERTALQSENVAGEYSYGAPDWERERARLLRRLMLSA